MTERSDRPGPGGTDPADALDHAPDDASELVRRPPGPAPDFGDQTIPIRSGDRSPLPDAPEVPRPSDMPSVPSMPGTESAPALPGQPDRPRAPSMPSLPSAPTAPGSPSLPSTPSAPSSPDLGSLGGGAAGAAAGVLPGGVGDALGTAASVAGAVQTAVAVGQAVAEGVSAIAHALSGGGETLPSVSYRFYPDDHGDLEWKVRSVRCTQALSRLYELHVGLAVRDLVVDPEDLLGASAELLVEREALTQRISGIVTRVTQVGLANGHQLVDVRVAPALEALTHRFDHRIFQDKSVPEIVTEVMGDTLAHYEREVRAALTREYDKREYVVQHGESDYDFCTRLLAEEGIAFFFDSAGEHEAVVLVDAPEPYESVETLDGQPVQLAPAGAELRVESLRTFEVLSESGTTSAVTREYDWTHPRVDIVGDTGGTDRRDRELQAYAYPGITNFFDYSEGSRKYEKNDVGRQARLSKEAHRLGGARFRGTGDVTAFLPGRTFELRGHVHARHDAKYLITSVTHEGECPDVVITDQGDESREADRYRMRFECVPARVAFRPARRPRSRIFGLESALVVGPAGEEIHTDPHGRIKVQFHWDRQGQRDEHSSCWLRVAQTWGGAGWGFTFIPRIGMEVLVAFLDGNPDRPIVVGSVHNGDNPHPRELPAEKTRSVIKTRSTPGSEGFNELSFEDRAGDEEVYLHAQKNLREEVLHDHATTVGANQSNTVTGDRSTSVSGSHSESVSGGQSVSVGGTRSVSVTRDQTHTLSANRTVSISANDTLAAGGTREVTVSGHVTETYSAGHRRAVTGMSHHSTHGSRVDRVTSTWLGQADVQLQLRQGPTTVTMEGTNITVDAAGNVEIRNPGCTLKMSGGDLAIDAQSSISIKVGGSEIKLTDGVIEVVGASSVKVESGGSTVGLTPGGIESSAGAISSSASGAHVIGGSPVQIN